MVLIFCIAGLLFFVPRARRTLGAYRIPLETGLLIPSGKGVLARRERLSNCFSPSGLRRSVAAHRLRLMRQRENDGLVAQDVLELKSSALLLRGKRKV